MLACKTVLLKQVETSEDLTGLFSGSLLNALVISGMFVYHALLKASLKGLYSFSLLIAFLLLRV